MLLQWIESEEMVIDSEKIHSLKDLKQAAFSRKIEEKFTQFFNEIGEIYEERRQSQNDTLLYENFAKTYSKLMNDDDFVQYCLPFIQNEQYYKTYNLMNTSSFMRIKASQSCDLMFLLHQVLISVITITRRDQYKDISDPLISNIPKR